MNAAASYRHLCKQFAEGRLKAQLQCQGIALGGVSKHHEPPELKPTPDTPAVHMSAFIQKAFPKLGRGLLCGPPSLAGKCQTTYCQEVFPKIKGTNMGPPVIRILIFWIYMGVPLFLEASKHFRKPKTLPSSPSRPAVLLEQLD